MKLPINCPICNSPLLNEYQNHITGGVELRKKCLSINHQLFIRADQPYENIALLSLRLGYNSFIYWDYENMDLQKSCFILTEQKPILTLPWFDPDFSNYKKLLNKIKLYCVFS